MIAARAYHLNRRKSLTANTDGVIARDKAQLLPIGKSSVRQSERDQDEVMKALVNSILKAIDSAIEASGLCRDGDALISLLFHNVFTDPKEIEQRIVHPQQYLTVDNLDQLIEYFQNAGYCFISPTQLGDETCRGKANVLLTFDDGYANNRYALEVLRSRNVPAILFVSTNHVRDNKAFWWDVLYRERIRQGRQDRLADEFDQLKRLPYWEIEDTVITEFGPRALSPVSDLDRPLTPDELRELASEPEIFIGNHTMDHAILTNLDEEQIESQIEGAQVYLEKLLGHRPQCISYPNGNTDDRVIETAGRCGLKQGITVMPRKNRPVPDDGELMKLGRYCITFSENAPRQYRSIRNDFCFSAWVREKIR